MDKDFTDIEKLYYLPKHLKSRWGTLRDFKDAKRRECKEILAALDRFRIASAYLPFSAYTDFLKMAELVDKIQMKISRKTWGR